MARFILDVANLMPHQIKQLQDDIFDRVLIVRNSVATMHCIDETNENQFHNEFENCESNELTHEQIEKFNSICNNV